MCFNNTNSNRSHFDRGFYINLAFSDNELNLLKMLLKHLNWFKNFPYILRSHDKFHRANGFIKFTITFILKIFILTLFVSCPVNEKATTIKYCLSWTNNSFKKRKRENQISRIQHQNSDLNSWSLQGSQATEDNYIIRCLTLVFFAEMWTPL